MSFQGGQQINLPQLSLINKAVIIATVGLFLLSSILKASGVGINLVALLGLSAAGFFHGLVYQLITYPFISVSLLGVVFNCLILWLLGSELERMWGPRRYILLNLISLIGSGVIYLIVTLLFFSSGPVYLAPLYGLIGICNFQLLAYAIIYPDRIFSFMLIFPMRARYFCMILIAMQLYMGFFSPGGNQAWGHLGGMLAGYIGMLAASSSYFKRLFDSSPNVRRKKSRRRGSAKLRIVPGDDDDDDERPPTYH
ncbi:MAG: rhomboid family intramembrane serine protease [Bdellovibrionales bacterium]|nr:rhomboid family intramembrane serine protease [Bdellovibrionales bacterium]MBT7765810.1 rhomboid family intramembrane serine protease [Bdellovibrionales bacterium]